MMQTVSFCAFLESDLEFLEVYFGFDFIYDFTTGIINCT